MVMIVMRANPLLPLSIIVGNSQDNDDAITTLDVLIFLAFALELFPFPEIIKNNDKKIYYRY